MDGTRRRRTFLLLGALLLVVAGLAKLVALQAEDPTPGGTVALRIDDPNGKLLYDGTLEVASGSNSVLDVLLQAARRDGFTVETQDFPGLGAMVVQIFSYRNSGPCGWVYEVDEVGGTKSAELELVTDGEHVRWFWSCHG